MTDESFVCNDCGKVFRLNKVDSTTISNHFTFNPQEFVSIRCLNHHVSHVHQERPFKCEECGLVIEMMH